MYLNQRFRFIFTLLYFSLLFPWLAACGGGQGSFTPEHPYTTPLPLEKFANSRWSLALLNGNAPAAGSTVTLAIYPDNYMQGLAGCNNYGVDYVQEGERIQLGTLHQTNQTCDAEGIMAQEAAYFKALTEVVEYRISEEALEFSDAEGQPSLVFERMYPPATGSLLPGTRWELTSLAGQPPLPGSKINLEFAPHALNGFSGCNFYASGSEYESYAATDVGEFHLLEMTQTLILCEEQIMAQEDAYLDALRRAASYQVTDDHLELRDADDQTLLVFARRSECEQALPDLVGTTWRLVSLDGTDPGEASTQLAFFDETWYVEQSRCAAYLSTYQVACDRLSSGFSTLLGQTCPSAGGSLGEFLEAPSTICLVGDELQITTRRGQVYGYQPVAETDPPALEGTPWKLLSIVGQRQVTGEPLPLPDPFPLQEGTRITLTLAGGNAFGSAGCNDYQASYTIDPALTFEAVGATKKACTSPEGIMEQEQRYLSALSEVSGYRILGGQLWLETTGGNYLVFAR